MSGIKFSNTTPAAPSGQKLVTFQNDGQGHISAAYAPQELVTLTAGENINAYQVVIVKSDGLVWKADAATTAHAGAVIGIADTSATTGNPLNIQSSGVMLNMGWSWTVGARVYVGLGGALTQTVPSGSGNFEQVIGIALSATELDINIGTPIVLA